MGEKFLRGLIVVALFVFVCVSWFVYDPSQWPAPVAWQALMGTSHPCGPLGLLTAHAMVACLGRVLSLLIPVSVAILLYGAMRHWKRQLVIRLQLRLLATALLGVLVAELAAGPGAGGFLGGVELQVLGGLLGRVGTTILLAVIGAALLLSR